MTFTRKVVSLLAIMCMNLFAGSALGQQAAQSLEHKKELTPLSATELMSVLRVAHVEQHGSDPSRARLAMAWAQVALENAHGRSVYNHNIGNVAPTQGQDYYFHVPKVKYRSYDTFLDGAKAYWRVVAWCKSAVRMFDAGMPDKAAENLKGCGYYEADVSLYVKGLSSLYHHALKTVIPEEEREQREKERTERARVEYESLTSFSHKCACCVWP